MRDLATRALDRAGIEWTETFLGCGPFVVADAVAAGLAVAVFAHRQAPAGTVEISQRFGLPPIPASQIVLLSALSDPRSRKAIRTVAAAFRTS